MYDSHTFWVLSAAGRVHQTPITYKELQALCAGGYDFPAMSTAESEWKAVSSFLPAPAVPPALAETPEGPPSLPATGDAPTSRCRSGYAVIDTETGGFDPRVNPLLSIALLAVDSEGEEIDGLALRVQPPLGTVLQVPIPAHMGVSTWKPTIHCCIDVATGAQVPAEAVNDPGRFHITPQAAEVNGFVQVDENKFWNLESAQQWMADSIPAHEADQILQRFLCRIFETAPLAVAHNAPFDRRFVRTHLPLTYANVACRPIEGRQKEPQWECTMQRLKRYRTANGLGGGKGSSTLEALAKFASYDNDNPHDALADAKACRAGLFWLLAQARG